MRDESLRGYDSDRALLGHGFGQRQRFLDDLFSSTVYNFGYQS